MTSARWTSRTGLVDAAAICRSTACCRSVITILAADPGMADLRVGECGEPGYLGQNGRNHARPVSTFGTSRVRRAWVHRAFKDTTRAEQWSSEDAVGVRRRGRVMQFCATWHLRRKPGVRTI